VINLEVTLTLTATLTAFRILLHDRASSLQFRQLYILLDPEERTKYAFDNLRFDETISEPLPHSIQQSKSSLNHGRLQREQS
jgi:hypothetical protein